MSPRIGKPWGFRAMPGRIACTRGYRPWHWTPRAYAGIGMVTTTLYSVGLVVPRGLTVARVNRFLYGWRISVNYGQDWEYELFETSWREARARLAEYRANCSYPVKATRGREPNPKYAETP